MQRYFGTDGIRGRAGDKLCPQLALRAAYGFAAKAAPRASRHTRRSRPRIVVGCDSRLSSPMLSAAVNAGLMLAGCDVIELGLVPTPVVALQVLQLKATGGVMVTASHNPVPDNGLKFFNRRGLKISKATERSIEEVIEVDGRLTVPQKAHFGRMHICDAAEPYLAFARRAISGRRSRRRLKIVLDCAHGATSLLAPPAFEQAGYLVTVLNADADGSRVNVRCGATDLSPARRAVRNQGADLGLAFDGDGDRVMAVDERGAMVNGDKIIALFATRLRRYRTEAAVVMTHMSNVGVEHALQHKGVRMLRTDVGDINVLTAMRRRGLSLGGEQSGHIIMRDKAPSGDGILVGLQLAQILRGSDSSFSAMLADFTEYPQLLTNIRVSDKHAWREDQQLLARLTAIRRRYPGVRQYIRPSGTEDLVRILTEEHDALTCQAAHEAACEAFEKWQLDGK